LLWRRQSLIAACETTGTIILILLFSFRIGRILGFEGAPQALTRAVSGNRNMRADPRSHTNKWPCAEIDALMPRNYRP